MDEARSRGLHASNVTGSHPDNFGFSGKKLYVLEKKVVFFRLGRLSRNGKSETLILEENVVSKCQVRFRGLPELQRRQISVL